MFYRAVEAGDLATLESYLAPEWKLYITASASNKGVFGRKGWLDSFGKMNEGGTRVRFEINSSEWGVGADMAWYRSDESVRWVRDGEEDPIMTARWLTTGIWVKREGCWLTVHTHHSYVDEE